jgi:energy-converting hydrogenase Eha subunit F
MTELNTPRTRTAAFYASVIVTLIAAVGIMVAYNVPQDSMAPKPVLGDPSKRIGTGNAPSTNPVTIAPLDKPAEKSR